MDGGGGFYEYVFEIVCKIFWDVNLFVDKIGSWILKFKYWIICLVNCFYNFNIVCKGIFIMG